MALRHFNFILFLVSPRCHARRRLAMAVVSDDHADPGLAAEMLPAGPGAGGSTAGRPREYRMEEVGEHDGHEGRAFFAVVDGFVVDATAFLDSHPGGLRKLLSANSPDSGHTGRAFGFSFARGRNAHFPGTGRRFRDGVQRYLTGAAGADGLLPPAAIKFESYGSIVILGRLHA